MAIGLLSASRDASMDAAYCKGFFPFVFLTCFVSVSQAEELGTNLSSRPGWSTLAQHYGRWIGNPSKIAIRQAVFEPSAPWGIQAGQFLRAILQSQGTVPDESSEVGPDASCEKTEDAIDEQPIVEMPIAPPPPPNYQWTRRRTMEFEYNQGNCS